MSNLPERSTGKGKSILSLVDDAVLVAVAVVGALVLLKVTGVIIGAIWTFVKIAALAGLVYVVLRGLRSRGR